MIVTYLRSSSYGCHEMCPMKFYIEYNLGWRGSTNIKAEKGTVVHKALEILAKIKLCQQNNELDFIDDVVGYVSVNEYDLDNIIEKCADYYEKHSENTWNPTGLDKRHCKQWTYKALEYNGGEFDPRNAKIVQPEQAFDITIDKPWAEYEYTTVDGEVLKGNFAIKGTIDQISEVDEDTHQILDWKTGKRLNWATGEEKTHAKLQKDPQLMMYFYAVKSLYPKIKYVDIVIYYINDGGPYRVCFSEDDMPEIEEMLKSKFYEIRDTKIPPLKKSWKCTKFCHFGRNTFKGTSLLPIVETRSGQVTPKGEYMTMCEQIRYVLSARGAEKTEKHCTKPGHKVDFYKAPGEVDK